MPVGGLVLPVRQARNGAVCFDLVIIDPPVVLLFPPLHDGEVWREARLARHRVLRFCLPPGMRRARFLRYPKLPSSPARELLRSSSGQAATTAQGGRRVFKWQLTKRG